MSITIKGQRFSNADVACAIPVLNSLVGVGGALLNLAQLVGDVVKFISHKIAVSQALTYEQKMPDALIKSPSIDRDTALRTEQARLWKRAHALQPEFRIHLTELAQNILRSLPVSFLWYDAKLLRAACIKLPAAQGQVRMDAPKGEDPYRRDRNGLYPLFEDPNGQYCVYANGEPCLINGQPVPVPNSRPSGAPRGPGTMCAKTPNPPRPVTTS